jgi:hypothetical protein
MESIAELNARGQRYNDRAGNLYMAAIVGLLILVVYAIFCSQYLLAVGIVAVGLMFLASVAFEVRGDKALQRADEIRSYTTPPNH